MDKENIFDKIQEILGNMSTNLNILEEQIDIDLQMEYFEYSRKLPKTQNAREVLDKMHELRSSGYTKPEIKDLLVRLAALDDVEAFRAIEGYLKVADSELRDWAFLACQESRMLLESKLLDQNQVFISTGLGGKGQKLRYFIALLPRDGLELTALHEKVVRSEFSFFLDKVNSELEEIEFHPAYVKLLVVIPLQISIKELFDRIIAECNEYGSFLQKHFIVTNVKHLSDKEILGFLEEKQRKEQKEE